MEHNEQNALEHLIKLFPKYSFTSSGQPINPATGNRVGKRLRDWLHRNCTLFPCETELLCQAWPNVEYVESRLMVRLWLNQDDKDKGFSARRLVKPGKAIKHLFPYSDFTDSHVAALVDRMRQELGERKYTLKTGETADDFRRAYTHTQAPYENPTTSGMRKSLANSCMRYDHIAHHDTRGNLVHPVEAYASGDFLIVWVEDQNGHIAARCVVYTARYKGYVSAPIYGVCERSMDMIQHWLVEHDADQCGDWIGAELRQIPADDGGYIAPYLDLSPRSLCDSGDTLVVDRDGAIDANDYGGILGRDERDTCHRCGSRYSAECEGGFVDSEHVCESCFEDANFCEYSDELTFDDGETVILWIRGSRVEQWWSDHYVDRYAIEINGEYWREVDLIEDYKGDYFTPEQLDNGEYFLSDYSNDYFPIDEMSETEEGEIVSKREFDHMPGIWEQNQDGIWCNVQLNLDLESNAA